MYRQVTESSNQWTGGPPPKGRTCEEICRVASRQAYYSWTCEGSSPQYLVLTAETTDITGCTPVTDPDGEVTGCQGTAKHTKTVIHTDTLCPSTPPEELASAFDHALAKVKKIEKEAEEKLERAKNKK
jgi:hypothetical protein